MPKHKKEIDKLRSRVRELEEENFRLREEVRALTEKYERRKLVDRAKGVLMEKYRWTEADAFKRLQRYSMQQRIPLIDLARRILNGENIIL